MIDGLPLPSAWLETEIEICDLEGEVSTARLLDASTVGILTRYDAYTVFEPWAYIRFVRKSREAKR